MDYSYLNGDVDQEYYREGIYVGYRYFDSYDVEPRYPFGYGLSYTGFSVETEKVEADGTKVAVTAKVTNTGSVYSGKEVVQLYVSCPQTGMAKEYQKLAAFAKTEEIKPGESKEEALIRECREELGVTVEVGDVFMEVTHQYPDITVHLTLFSASIREGVPQKLEHQDIRWITAEEIGKFSFCPADTEILEKLKRR